MERNWAMELAFLGVGLVVLKEIHGEGRIRYLGALG